jgi:PIN domain-containing protein
LRFFFDNTLALAHARAFKALCEADEHKIVHLRERFEKENIPDEEWIPAIAADGEWIVITGDTNIYKNPHRRRVWLAARLTTFFLADGFQNLKFWLQMRYLVKWWPDFETVAQRVTRGSAFKVPMSGSKLEPLQFPPQK